MKKFLTIVILLSAVGFSKAQQTTINDNRSKLKVTAYVKYDLKPMKYRVKFTIREDNYADQWGKIATVEDIQSKFLESLEAKGIDTSKFKANNAEYALANYYDKGTILTYETTNRKELETILTTKRSKNVNLFKTEMYCKSSKDQYKKLVVKGLEKADTKARMLARQIGKSIDKLELVEDAYYDRSEWVYMSGQTQQYYTLTTTYSLK
ncbi:hypothetical protein ABN763_08015 [Spongiivirga sp. MCCC 1A20706]|uniref:hypothetical protein n=1 Tax=Spongiivirga sp. MCCC 1A20706 TaxID=3160963 RepID=UPI0039779D67